MNMTSGLDTIDALARQFEQAVSGLSGRDPEGSGLILSDDNPLVHSGEQILDLYEAEARQTPNDVDVRCSTAQHLLQMGWLYYAALPPSEPAGRTNAVAPPEEEERARYSERACGYMAKSFRTMPSPHAAATLGELFRGTGYYGSALYWYEEAKRVGGDCRGSGTADRDAKGIGKDSRSRRSARPTLSESHDARSAVAGILDEARGAADVRPSVRRRAAVADCRGGGRSAAAGDRRSLVVHEPRGCRSRFRTGDGRQLLQENDSDGFAESVRCRGVGFREGDAAAWGRFRP